MLTYNIKTLGAFKEIHLQPSLGMNKNFGSQTEPQRTTVCGECRAAPGILLEVKALETPFQGGRRTAQRGALSPDG